MRFETGDLVRLVPRADEPRAMLDSGPSVPASVVAGTLYEVLDIKARTCEGTPVFIRIGCAWVPQIDLQIRPFDHSKLPGRWESAFDEIGLRYAVVKRVAERVANTLMGIE